MKVRVNNTGVPEDDFQEVYVKVGDNIPVGAIVEFDGDTIPVGWEDYGNGKIKKVSQTVPTYGQIVNGKSSSTTDAYSTKYINENYLEFEVVDEI